MNHALKMFVRGEKSIKVKINNCVEWNFNAGLNEVVIMMSLVDLYLKEFDPELIFSGDIEISYWNGPYPIIEQGERFEFRKIRLTAKKGCHEQMVYQLSHELTHYFLKDNGSESASWLYETVAETASMFFLKKLNDAFSLGFGGKFFVYRENHLCLTPCIINPRDWYRKNEGTLLLEKTNRELNRQVAKKLLPCMESSPGCWNVLLYAPLENAPLSTILQKWMTRVPEQRKCDRILLEKFHTIFLGNV